MQGLGGNTERVGLEAGEGRWLVQNPLPSQVSTNLKEKTKNKNAESAIRAIVRSSCPEAWIQTISFSGRGSYRSSEKEKSGERIIQMNKQVSQGSASASERA